MRTAAGHETLKHPRPTKAVPLLTAASDPRADNQVATGAGALAGSVLLAGFAYGLRMLQLIEWRLCVAGRRDSDSETISRTTAA